jgi:hypothetical protein
MDGPTPWGVLAKQPVYIARAFYTDQLMSNSSLLEDTVEFGEFYRMSDTPFDPDCPYRSRHRNIMMYNYPTDAFAEFGLKTALDHCFLFKEDGQPLYLDDTHSILQYSPRISNEHDRQRDYFSYVSQLEGKYTYTNAALMGELELHYWTVEDKIHQAISGLDAIAHKMGQNVFAKAMQDLTNGQALVRQIANLPYDPVVEAELLVTYGPGQNGDNVDISPRTGLREVRQNAITGFAQRRNGRVTPAALSPGFQSFPGLNEIAQNGDANTLPEKKIAADTVQAIRLLVGYIKDMYPGSIYINPDFASPHWWFPTAEITFFENFIHKGNNPPTFFATDSDAATGKELQDSVAAAVNAWSNEIPKNAQITAPVPADVAGQVAFFLRASLLVASGLHSNEDASPALLASLVSEVGIDGKDAFTPNWSAPTRRAASQKASDVLVRLGTKYPNTGYGRFANRADAAEYIGQIESMYDLLAQSVVAAPPGELQAKEYLRSPLLASSTYMATLHNALVPGGNGTGHTLVADPVYPIIPANRQRLEVLTRGFAQRTGQSENERQAALETNVGNHLVDGSMITKTLPLGNNTLFMNVISTAIGMNLGSSSSGSASRQVQMSIGQAQRTTPIDSSKLVAEKTLRRKTALTAEVLAKDLQLGRAEAVQRAVDSRSLKRLMDYGERMLSENFKASWKQIEEQSQNPLVLALAHIYDGMLIHKRVFSSFIDNNIRIPLDFIVTRPHISLRQLTAIKLQAGTETMFTAVAPGQFELADDAAVQGHIGTLTSKHKAVCTTPENVYIQKGIFINGVNGGLGMIPINPIDYNCGRGNFAGQDIIVVPVAPHDVIDGSLFSLTGDLSVAELEGLGLTHNDFLQYETTARISKIYGCREVRHGISYSETAVDSVPRNVYSNVLCMPGTFIKCSPRENKFNIVVQGQSMLQGLIYPGCAAVLCGKMTEVNRNPWTAYLQY